jgi:hypothetical protein
MTYYLFMNTSYDNKRHTPEREKSPSEKEWSNRSDSVARARNDLFTRNPRDRRQMRTSEARVRNSGATEATLSRGRATPSLGGIDIPRTLLQRDLEFIHRV